VLKTASIDADDAEFQFRFEPADASTPDRLFDRVRASTLLESVLGLLAQDYVQKGRADVFDRLKVVLFEGRGQSRRPNWPPSSARGRAP
jgi:hypothetical protein